MPSQDCAGAELDTMKVVICGGGIMGVSTAYYLSLRGVAATVIDCCGIACAASGMAGAVLSQNPMWLDPPAPYRALLARGFEMHQELATQFPGCGYRRISGMRAKVQEGGQPTPRGDKFDWIDGPVTEISLQASPDMLLQVLPKKLTEAFFHAAEARGASFVKGTIEQVNFSSDDKVTGVTVDGREIEANFVVIALGPWYKRVAPWLDIPIIETNMAAGIILKPLGLSDTPYLFTLDVPIDLPDTFGYPQVQLRSDGTVYLSGLVYAEPLPDYPSDVKLNQTVLRYLEQTARSVSSRVAAAEVERYLAGPLSFSPDNSPFIGQVAGKEGCYLNNGHGGYGILAAPSSSTALAELIVTGRSSSIDLTPFDPQRFCKS